MQWDGRKSGAKSWNRGGVCGAAPILRCQASIRSRRAPKAALLSLPLNVECELGLKHGAVVVPNLDRHTVISDAVMVRCADGIAGEVR